MGLEYPDKLNKLKICLDYFPKGSVFGDNAAPFLTVFNKRKCFEIACAAVVDGLRTFWIFLLIWRVIVRVKGAANFNERWESDTSSYINVETCRSDCLDLRLGQLSLEVQSAVCFISWAKTIGSQLNFIAITLKIFNYLLLENLSFPLRFASIFICLLDLGKAVV